MTQWMIEAQHVTKYFGKTRALEKWDMQVPTGCIYGLLGRNGAGKTTALQMIMGLLLPSSGTLQVLGYPPRSTPLKWRQKIGYASDTMTLPGWFKVAELLNYNGAFYVDWDSTYVKQWIDRLQLPLDRRVSQLSKGDREKLGLLMAIGHRPHLLILDEPASGLDPIARREFLESLIELLHESGTTIVLSSHLISDLERMADQIGILHEGHMLLEASQEQLKLKTRQIRLIHENMDGIQLDGLKRIDKGHNTHLAVFLDLNWDPAKLKKIQQQFPSARIETESLKLEDIFGAYVS